MEIREGHNCVTIEPVDRVPAGLPSAGDVKLSVEVVSDQFSGHGFAWIAAPALAAYLAQLRELEARRQGRVTIEGLSPEEFRLRLWSVDRRGHMAVGGLVTKRVHNGEGSPYRHAVEFGFEFDPTLLPRVLAGFQAIAEGRAKPVAARDRAACRFHAVCGVLQRPRSLSVGVRHGKATGKETLMPGKKPPGKLADTKGTPKPTKSTTGGASKGFTDEKRAAMRERAQELKAAVRRSQRADKADGESAVLAKIAEMPEPDRTMAKRLHAIIKASASPLTDNLVRDARVRQERQGNLLLPKRAEVQTRYATFGFSDKANLDEGAVWPTAFARRS